MAGADRTLARTTAVGEGGEGTCLGSPLPLGVVDTDTLVKKRVAGWAKRGKE
jgi:hypothetical protein